ncbi:hypothetical protein [Synechococcus sp. CCY 9618]|uniref:hypothetical protein n=1 Tax=Synechococcus sp. CCY 9618 TaxID=2815602 RepID=UPI001C24B7DB|nr:hypothetical protein [Synechococcus sp. CCY 9618]
MPPAPSNPGEGAPAFTYRFLHRIEPAGVERFLAVQERLMSAAHRYPGFVAETVPTPLGRESHGQRLLYQSELSFASPDAFMGWMDSRERRALLSPAEQGGYRYEGSSDWDGYAQWLQGSVDGELPAWKVNLIVLLVLYPSVMVLGVLLKPLPLDFPTALLLGNVCSVALTGWLLVPWASRLLQPWLEGSLGRRGRSLTLAGILLALVLMLQLFRTLPATRVA